MNNNLSKKSIRDLMSGKYLPSTVFDKEGVLVENEYFVDIKKDSVGYKNTFYSLGMELCVEDEYCYAVDLEKEKDNKTQIKDFMLFLVLFKYLDDKGINIEETLLNPLVGISLDESFFTSENTLEACKRAGIGKADDALYARFIASKNPAGNTYLTDVGIHFYNHILDVGTSKLLDVVSE